MMRSIAVPGWGQATNGRWLKAALFAGAESYFLYKILEQDRLAGEDADRSRRFPDEAFYWRAQSSAHRDSKRDHLWWGAFTVLLSAGDAYVDAHLHGFRAEFREEDSAVLLSIGVNP